MGCSVPRLPPLLAPPCQSSFRQSQGKAGVLARASYWVVAGASPSLWISLNAACLPSPLYKQALPQTLLSLWVEGRGVSASCGDSDLYKTFSDLHLT